MDEGIGLGCFVNPALIQEFGKLAVGDNEFQFHKSCVFTVDFHKLPPCRFISLYEFDFYLVKLI